MGNEVSGTKSLQKTKRLIASKLGVKLSEKRINQKSNDPFIVHLFSKNNNINNEINDIQQIDQRRTVFISLIGLFQTYKDCPSYILYSSLIIVPLKHEWIYKPYKYQDELQSHFVSNLSFYHQDQTEINEFIQFLKWKDFQGFVFWALDDRICNDRICNKYDNQLLIAPFWRYFSSKLSSLYDPITGNKHKPFQFDGKWWHNSFDNKTFSKYNTKLSSILSELSSVTMKYKTMQEILYQSNPRSLNPVIFYGQESNVEFLNDISLLKCDDSDHDDDNQDLAEQEWYISTDYDPYDL